MDSVNLQPILSRNVLHIDCSNEVDKISRRLRELLSRELHRRGLVVALSGGVDSSVSAALCTKAVGPGKVLGLMLPERDSSSGSVTHARALADHLGIDCHIEDITETLSAIGCYRWRDNAIRHVFPDYQASWKSKIVIEGSSDGRVNHFALVVQAPDGKPQRRRLGLTEYLQIVAATNFKQRVRKTLEYFHADRLNYAVVGTPNRLEYDQGFFVKNGDGSADVKPIAHLYKTQVYALARYFALPEEICTAQPTTDTYSLPQGQDEFYFVLPYYDMDLALWAYNGGFPPAALADALGIEEAAAHRVYRDIQQKRRTTRYLHARPALIEELGSAE